MNTKINAEIKICGLKTVDDIYKINNFSIDYVGFVFAESKRRISKEVALEMKKALRADIKVVGVFADMKVSEVREISDYVDLDVVQLHSDEDDSFCRNFKNRVVWKSISVNDENPEIIAKNYKNVDGFILDTYTKGLWGGSGKTFKWNLVRDFSKKYFTVLAGGLCEENILAAYETVKPNVLDLSSSVETDGIKDYNKIKSLMRRIKYEYK